MIRSLRMAAGLAFTAATLIAVCTNAAAAKRDLDYERLRASLSELSADPALGPLAPAERAAAERAVQALTANGSVSKQLRAHLVFVAERRIDIAYAAAQAADQERKLALLEREHDQILLAASRRDAELARLDAEKQHILSEAQAEETDRLRQEAEQARAQGEQAAQEVAQAKRLVEAQAKEVELARQEAKLTEATAADIRARLNSLRPTRGPHGLQMTLDDIAFAPGQAGLRPETRGHLGKLVAFANQNPRQLILIEGHTDSRGSPKANQALSQQRANAVREALVAAGVNAQRMTAVGRGEDEPVASNDSDEGRAKNRRVDVILQEQRAL